MLPSKQGRRKRAERTNMFREMRRIKQQLTFEQDVQILTQARRGVLSVLGDDGYPYGIPLNFVYDPDTGDLGSIFFHTALTGHKVDALIACDKASFCVMDDGYRNEGEWWFYVNSVICFGRAFIIEEPKKKYAALAKLGKKYFPPEVDLQREIDHGSARIHLMEFKIEHMTGKLVQEK